MLFMAILLFNLKNNTRREIVYHTMLKIRGNLLQVTLELVNSPAEFSLSAVTSFLHTGP